MGLLEWIGGILRDFVDLVLRPVFDWIAKQINWLTAQLRVWKHEFLVALGAALDDDIFFRGFLGISIVTTVLGAIIVPQLTATLWVSVTKPILDRLKLRLDQITRLMIDLQFFDTLLRIIWPHYREVAGVVNLAVAGLMEELALDSGYLLSWFAALRGVMYNTYALLGLPVEAAEIEAISRTRDAAKRLNERFETYAHHPELIVTDFIVETLIPAATELSDSQAALRDDIRTNYDTILAREQAVEDLRSTIDSFVASLPEEIKADFETRWARVEKYFDMFIDWFDANWRPYVEGFIDAFETRTALLEAANKQAEANMRSPVFMLAASEEWTEEERSLWDAFIYQSNLKASEAAYSEGVKETDKMSDELNRRFDMRIEGVRGAPSLAYEPAGVEAPATTAEALKEDWFVGEY